MEHAKDGYAFFRVVTPQVAVEHELPLEGELQGDDAFKYEILQEIADLHHTSIQTSPYRTL